MAFALAEPYIFVFLLKISKACNCAICSGVKYFARISGEFLKYEKIFPVFLTSLSIFLSTPEYQCFFVYSSFALFAVSTAAIASSFVYT